MAKVKKYILLVLLLGGALGGALLVSKCSEEKHFTEERTYVYDSAEMHFYNNYEKFAILNGKTEVEFINSYPLIKFKEYNFKTNGNVKEFLEGALTYTMYYEAIDGVVKIYNSSKKDYLIMTFEGMGNYITTKLYDFGDVGSGQSYIEITYRLSED